MPFLTFSETSLTLPDQTQIIAPFSGKLTTGKTALVGRNGSGKSTLLRAIAGVEPIASGAIVASGPVRLLRQSEPFEGAALVDLFVCRAALEALQNALSGDLEDADRIDWTLEERLEAALARVGLDLPVTTPLAQLSGGQSRRAALAALFFDVPEIVLLDEPSNDLDADGRALLFDLLDSHRGLALVASHDRALLERMDGVMDLTEQGVRFHAGGWAGYAALRETERARAAQDLQRAEAALSGTRKQVAEAEARKARRARTGKALRGSGSQPKVLLDKAKDGAEARAAGQARLAERQVKAAETRLESARAAVDRAKSLGFDLPATDLPPGRQVLHMSGLRFRHPGAARGIEGMALDIHGPERIRLLGGNGVGKSTLLRLIAGELTPESGRIERWVRVAYLDQRLDGIRSGAGRVLDHARAAIPELDENGVRALLARFLFRNDAALVPVSGLSGGERLRLGLALALGQPDPARLLLLDEPTSHLDLDAVEAVEAALAGYDGAMIVVTHDAGFAGALGLTREIALTGAREAQSPA
ncbi:ATP-binding cassette domain-containing protein [Primorskyibacter aestuariivivens]|uniref:ATP-binding cassette domain-containing protein n=1 Tax=Primorskyibacter aestuariivivens TaxID=1888912 RepID=UPI00230037E6|nr:ATP-binding cassette domain-containing protein [Primorskyibacter aestuariivivens]MDA7430741.1 ATP-binding cassette domain-containing protein [Primorskyibacter aestuariivivens]